MDKRNPIWAHLGKKRPHLGKKYAKWALSQKALELGEKNSIILFTSCNSNAAPGWTWPIGPAIRRRMMPGSQTKDKINVVVRIGRFIIFVVV